MRYTYIMHAALWRMYVYRLHLCTLMRYRIRVCVFWAMILVYINSSAFYIKESTKPLLNTVVGGDNGSKGDMYDLFIE